MIRLRAGLLLWAALLLPAWAWGGVLKPFGEESLAQITESREGRPFLLALWSIDCPPCLRELGHLAEIRTRYPGVDLVLVSTDGEEAADEVSRVLASFGLEDGDTWLFSGGFPERLRYGIDPGWYGELPRAYFYDAAHARRAGSGTLTLERLQAWAESLPNAPRPVP